MLNFYQYFLPCRLKTTPFFKIILKPIFTLLLLCCITITNAQGLMSDATMQETISKGMDKMYNFEFDAAEQYYKIVHDKYPQHPIYDFLMSQSVYWKSIYYNKFKDYTDLQLTYLHNTLDLCEKMLKKDEHDPEGIFFSLSAYSALALYHSQVSAYMDCIYDARKIYSYMKEGFKLKEKYVEFYFSSGLYDYFIVEYPQTRPVVKPFLIFFASGDKARGITELDYGSRHALYTRIECMAYIANIFIKYENMPQKGLSYTTQLVTKFPRNLFYLTRHTEALVAIGNYEQAEKNSLILYKSQEKQFEMASYVFYGIINEKHYNKLDTAKAYYNQAINLYKTLQFPDRAYESFAYAGLARIADRKGDKKKAVNYYKKALGIAEHKSIKTEANAYLDKND